MDQGSIVARTRIVADSRLLSRGGVRSLRAFRGDVEIGAFGATLSLLTWRG